jgi:uncharacterized protein
MTELRISPALRLPVDAVTETIAILAKRGAGKTYTASVLVEEMLRAKLQVVVVDPIGAWWGLRAGADGKADGGYQVAVLGGDRGDVPLEPTGGRLVADLVVDERLSAVLDLSGFSKGDRRRFVADFLERLYQRNRDPMHVVLEEADLFAPEGRLKRAGDEAMLGAVYDLVRRGRSRGLGATLITQRSASISKEVLTQAEILIALRTTGPHDRAAIEEWIKFHGSKEERDVVLGELSGLPTGTAFVWWPVEEILRKVEIRERRTFDSSATPKPGERRRAPKTLADVDLEALRTQMAATIEKAKAEDPKELRRQVADLRRQLQKRPTETERVEVPVEVPVIRNEDVEQLERILAPAVNGMSERLLSAVELAHAVNGLAATLQDAQVLLEEIRDRAGKTPGLSGRGSTDRSGSARASVDRPRPESARKPRAAPRPPREQAGAGDADDIRLGRTERAILNVLAQFPDGRTKQQVSILSGYSIKSSGFTNALGRLRRFELITPAGVDPLRITQVGIDQVGDVAPLPTGPDLLHHWLGHLGKSERAILTVLYEAYPEGITKEEISERSGYSVTSSGFTNALGKLRTLQLAEGYGEVRASEAFFEEAIA